MFLSGRLDPSVITVTGLVQAYSQLLVLSQETVPLLLEGEGGFSCSECFVLSSPMGVPFGLGAVHARLWLRDR